MFSQEFFATHPVFTHDEFARSRDGGSPRTVDSLLRKYAARGRILRIRRGLYAVVPPGAKGNAVEIDPYLVATKVTDDATVSHHAALQFHGRTYSVWNRVSFFSHRSIRLFRFGATEFAPIRLPSPVAELPDMGGGIECVSHGGGEVRVTTCERAMVDVLHYPELGGGWEEIWRSLEMVEFFELDAVISYALALNTAVTAARVGLFLEQHREALFVEERHLEMLEAHRPRQNRYLDRFREPGKLVSRWRLIVPERVLGRHWEEIA
jgi:predicted transcriptional regulator of viral defense system